MLASLYLSLTHILLAMHERPALTIAPAAAAADTGMDQAPPLATSTKVHYVQGLLDELASTQEYQELADGLGAVYNLLVHRGSQIHRQHMGGDDSLRELLDTRRSVLLAFKNPAGTSTYMFLGYRAPAYNGREGL